MLEHLQAFENFQLLLSHSVKDLQQKADKRWLVTIKDEATSVTCEINAGFVFVGAGGATLPLLLIVAKVCSVKTAPFDSAQGATLEPERSRRRCLYVKTYATINTKSQYS